MMRHAAALCAALVCSTLVGVAGVVVAPKQLRAGERALLSVSSPTDTAQLLLPTGPIAAVATDAPHMLALTVPGSAPPGSYTLETGDGSVSVEVVARAGLVVVELDKGKYKPGQSVRARVVSTDSGLMPLVSTVTLKLRDPTGFAIFRKIVETDVVGVAAFMIPLATEPTLGHYKIEVDAATASLGSSAASASFEVEEYVLPRFDVQLTTGVEYIVAQKAPPALTGKVVAKYTYGEIVAGKVWVMLLEPVQQQYNSPGRGPAGGGAGRSNMPELRAREMTRKAYDLGVDGSVAFSLDLASVYVHAGLTLQVSVEDAASGEIQTAVKMIPYVQHELSAGLVMSSTYFKPGLPVAVQLSVRRAVGSSATGVATVVLERQYPSYASKQAEPLRQDVPLEGDLDKVVVFNFPQEDPSCCNVAIAPQPKDSCCVAAVQMHVEVDGTRMWGSTPEGTQSSLCLTRATSFSNHFVSLVTVQQSDASKWAIDVFTTFSLSSGKRLKLFVVSRSNLVASATVAIPVASTPSVSGPFTLTYVSDRVARLEVAWTADMAPVASLTAVMDLDAPVMQPKDCVTKNTKGKCELWQSIWTTDSQPVSLAATARLERALTWNEEAAPRLSFSKSEVRPAEGVALTITAPSAATVFILGVDRSVQLMGGRSEISRSALQQSLKGLQATQGPVVHSRVWKECHDDGTVDELALELDDSMVIVGSPRNKTDCPISLEGYFCSHRGGGDMMMDMIAGNEKAMPEMAHAPAAAGARGNVVLAKVTDPKLASVARVRSFFPETWVWESVQMDSAKHGQLSLVAPDTITSWQLSAFAVAPQQPLAPAQNEASLIVKQPLFVQLSLPYALIRGEDTPIVATVFNHHESSLDVQFRLELPVGVEPVGGSTMDATVNVVAGAFYKHTVRVRATLLGTHLIKATVQGPAAAGLADAVQRPLLVKAEGVSKSHMETKLLTDDAALTASFEASFPSDIVPGSARASLSVVGDFMSPSMQGLQKLLQFPTGCGEQNMMSLVPNIFVRKYLTQVGRLSAEVDTMTLQYMLVGYQRELTYRHNDGSFSAFGDQDAEGSTWLTAFVVKTFAEMSSSLYVDPTVLQDAIRFLIAQQQEDGSFRRLGTVIHKEMMGGVGGGKSAAASLTAFVALALTAAKDATLDLQVDLDASLAPAAKFLNTELTGELQYSSTMSTGQYYARVLSLRARYKAGAMTEAVVSAQLLEMASTDAAGDMSWSAQGAPAAPEDPSPWKRSHTSSSHVELTGYAVVTLLDAGLTSQAFKSVLWLLKKRGAQGGFVSTQDTVVGLSALATFAGASAQAAALTVNVEGAVTATSFSVEPDTFDLMQSVDVVAGATVLARATGTGMALAMLTTHYNVPQEPAVPSYRIEVFWKQRTPDLHVVTACVAPKDASPLDNVMTMVTVGLYSGYSPNVKSLKQLVASKLVMRYDVDDEGVQLYLNGLDKHVCVEFEAIREFVVGGLQAANNAVFEYYNPERKGAAAQAWDATSEAVPSAEWDAAVARAKDPFGVLKPGVKTSSPTPPSGSAGLSAGLIALATASRMCWA